MSLVFPKMRPIEITTPIHAVRRHVKMILRTVACQLHTVNRGMPFKYRLDFGASEFVGKEAEIAVGERLIRCKKDAEFLDDRGETFGEQVGNEGGGYGVSAVIRDHTQVQHGNLVLSDVVEESGEVGE